MKEIFDTNDTSNQGFIKASTLGLILRTLGFNPRESDLERVRKEFDPDSKTEICYIKSLNSFIFLRHRSIKIS
jgi:Ca2+-binding EF-hand superfamily protein